MNAQQAQRMQARLQEAAAERAKTLDQIGMAVYVKKDDGTTVATRTLSLPWQLGHGAWVVKVEGISGGFDVLRVVKAA